MAKSKSKKMDKKTEQMFRASEVGAILERMEGKIDAIGEGLTIVQEELRDFKKEMYEFKDEMYLFRDEMYEFKSETKSNFKTVFEYFSNLDEEIKDIKKQLEHLKEGSMDEDNRISIMERVNKLEKEVEQFRIILKLKKA